MKRDQRTAWWLLVAVSMVPASSCLDFDSAERRFCDAGNSLLCGNTGARVTVQINPSATTTRCVKVVGRPPGRTELSSPPIPRPSGADSVTWTVYQGSLPDDITLLARGYDDPLCGRLNEEGLSNAVRFVRGTLLQVDLHLNGSPCIGADAGAPCPGGLCQPDQSCLGTEVDCSNGADDDFDGKPDCLDPDCFAVACASPDQCLLSPVCQADGGCAGSGPKPCDTPPGFCFASPGTCSPANGTCSYAPDASIACDDSSRCTTADHCLMDGGCGGAPVICNTPPGACYGASNGCDLVLGCQYPVLTGTACSDGDPCTFGDQCASDGGCAGTPYGCPPSECMTSACLGDGGCSATPRTGQSCTGGVCNSAGACVTFPYTPSNFDPVAVANGGVGGDLLISCNAWFNSTNNSGSWCGQPPPRVVAITQSDGTTPAVVLAMSGLNVAASGSLAVMGNRPVILAVYGDATIDGVLSARSQVLQDAGAGAMPSAACGAQNGNVAQGEVGSGGGGGSYGTNGGNAGDLTGAGGVPGGNGGGPNGSSTIVPLRGGCGGGEGGRPNDVSGAGGHGGAGGGAVQVSAARFLQVTGSVTASGAGGQGGLRDQIGGAEGGNGGGGGGSGGAVLLEGQNVLMPNSARLTSNGGGGGEGGDGSIVGNNGASGGDGTITAALGGSGGAGLVSCAGDGSNGGSAGVPPGNALSVNFASGGCATGGGGGAAGRIRVNGYAGCQVDAGVQSPIPTFGNTCP